MARQQYVARQSDGSEWVYLTDLLNRRADSLQWLLNSVALRYHRSSFTIEREGVIVLEYQGRA